MALGEQIPSPARIMKISSGIRLAALAVAVSFVASCAHTPAQVKDTLRRFHEDAAANVVLHFGRWDSVSMIRPDTRENGFLPLFNREDVARRLGRSDVRHDLAVVLVGYTYAPQQVDDLFREWKSFLNERGFRRVVILRAGMDYKIDGLPILRDSAIAGGT